jgi:SGNH hydrolase-like domain, acetyltransferase AlgX
MSSTENAMRGVAPLGLHRGGPTDPSHDEDLRRGILRTDVSRPIAAALGIAFLAVIYAVPISQAICDRATGNDSILFDLFRRAPTKENLKEFEEDLDKESTPRQYVRPRVQGLLSQAGHYGSKKAVIGRGGWLFYGPGIAAVGGPGFLDPATMASRTKTALDAGDGPLSPDPRPAIFDFGRFLGGRGIKLVLFPVPDKASLQPIELHGRVRDLGQPPAHNPDAPRLVAELEDAGILVFDPAPEILPPAAPPFFIPQDTHWTPAWMEVVAARLGRFLVTRGALPEASTADPRRWRAVAKTVSRVGDLTDMLGLPEGQSLFSPVSLTIHEVQDPAGVPFEPDQHASVLVLGDSFTNVFSLDQMGWGASAGLGAQLALALGRDVDVIAQNDAGAHATRQLLFNALAGGEDRLAGKSVVVWELASRELAVGDFRPVDWSGLAPSTSARTQIKEAAP